MCACVHAQSCPTLCDSMDWSPPGSTVHGIFLARMLEWVNISFSRGSSGLRDWTHTFCICYVGRQILYHCATWKAQEIGKIFHWDLNPNCWIQRPVLTTMPWNLSCCLYPYNLYLDKLLNLSVSLFFHSLFLNGFWHSGNFYLLFCTFQGCSWERGKWIFEIG